MDILNSAIIGCGAIHSCHVNALRQIPNVALRALVNTDSVKGLKLGMAYQCRFYQDYREMLLDDTLDVVHICTPHFEHKNMILAALNAGKHVFCEKPVVMNSSELADIMAAAAQATGKLGVCYQNRLNPTSLRIRKELEDGGLGKMLSIRAVLTWSRSGAYYTDSPWRGRLATEGGSLLINQAIHTLDLMQWFAGGVTRLKGVVDSGELTDVTEGEDSAIPRCTLPTARAGCFTPATAIPRTRPCCWRSTASTARCSLMTTPSGGSRPGSASGWRATQPRTVRPKATGGWATSRRSAAFITPFFTRRSRTTPISAPPDTHSGLWRQFIGHLNYGNG